MSMKNIIANSYGLDCYEKNGVIYFEAASRGVSLKEYVRKMSSKIGSTFISETRDEIFSHKFTPTRDRVIKVAILKRSLLDNKRGNYQTMELYAEKHKYKRPCIEDAHIIYDILNPELLNLFGVNWLNIMIKPVYCENDDDCKMPVIYFSKQALRMYFVSYEKFEDCSDDDGFIYLTQ